MSDLNFQLELELPFPWLRNNYYQVSIDSYSTQRELQIQLPKELELAYSARKNEFLAGRFCATSLLKKLGSWTYEIPIGSNKEPLWPTEFVGSITHTPSIAAAVVFKKKFVWAVGIDAEEILSSESEALLRPLILNPSEVVLIQRSGMDFPQVATILFSAKESIFKSLYPTFRMPFNFSDIEVLNIDFNLKTFKYRLRNGLRELSDKQGQGFFHLQKTLVFTLVLDSEQSPNLWPFLNI